jgi:hypothetical protein
LMSWSARGASSQAWRPSREFSPRCNAGGDKLRGSYNRFLDAIDFEAEFVEAVARAYGNS